jgi:hypothetical protein
MHDPFNVNFYIVSATVTPLLYVALILQGSLTEDLERMNKKIGQYEDRLLEHAYKYPSRFEHYATGLRFIAMSYIWALVGFTAFVLSAAAILAGLLGEGLSLWCLFYQSDTFWIRETVLWSMVALLAAMAIRPILAICKVAWVKWWD